MIRRESKSEYEKRWGRDYKELNAEQRRAVDLIEGPVMVVAGPGTGKTQILTLRIANILLKTDTDPGAILALTFTEAAATNMRRRLAKIIGASGYYVNISTFHSFCNSIIQDFPEYFPLIIGGRSIDEVGQVEILEEILNRGGFKDIRPIGNPIYYVKSIMAKIRDFKNEGLEPNDILKAVKEEEEVLGYEKMTEVEKTKQKKKLARNRELAEVYEKYMAKMAEKRFYDYEDMVLEVQKAIEEHKDMLAELQETYQYILVDEHQDTNGAQNKVAEMIAGFFERPNIFVVGDEKQAIYRFQGASLENFLFFKKKFKDVKVITLKTNYRSRPAILKAAGNLIVHNKEGLDGELKSVFEDREKKPRVVEFDGYKSEVNWLAKEIGREIEAGVKAEEIGVLHRENKEARELAEALTRQGIEVAVESDGDLLDEIEVKKFIKLWRAVENVNDDEAMAEAIHLDFLGLNSLSVYQILELKSRTKGKILKIMSDGELLSENKVAEIEKVRKTALNIIRWRQKSRNEDVLTLVARMARESGFLAHILRDPQAPLLVDKLSIFFETLKKVAPLHRDFNLKDALNYLNLLIKHQVKIKGGGGVRKPGAVRIMTAHKAKGLEFDVVFIVNAVSSKWGKKKRGEIFVFNNLPSRQLAGSFDIDDERRLFYMAMTRARRRLNITYSLVNAEGREQAPSQFIGEIDENLLEILKKEKEDKEERGEWPLLPAKKPVDKNEKETKEWIREIWRQRELAVTGLNNYLSCPWKFFYSNLLRLPQAKPAAASFGTAVHYALNAYLKAGKSEGREVDENFLLAEFELALSKEYLREIDRQALIEKGREILPKYLRERKESWRLDALGEMKVDAILPGTEIKLTGKLDKVERIGGSSKSVMVTDYKTGKPKSRNEIEGKTKNSTGDYKRQLVFYKLLLDYSPKDLKMEKGVVDFVESQPSGKLRDLDVFEITEEESEELKEMVKRVWKEIYDLVFWDKRCGEKDCVYCELREMIGGEDS